jgi:DNA-binding response OmpR family regulator
VIVVSAKTAAQDIARATELGAADYVTKPFSVSDLKRVIDRAVANPQDAR